MVLSTLPSRKIPSVGSGGGGFVWLHLEDQGDRGLRAFSESLDIDDRALRVLTAASRRPSFDVAARGT